MQLIKYEGNLAPSLNKQEEKIVLATQSPRLSESNPVDLVGGMVTNISQAYVILGHSKKINDDDIGVMATLVVEKLIEKHPNFRADEIWNAIRNGAFGEYDNDVVYVSATNILRWCEKYQSKKAEVLMKQMQYNEKLQEEQREKDHQDKTNQYWDDLHLKVEADLKNIIEGKEISISSWVYFESLQNIGIIKVSNAEKLKKFKEVKEKVIVESQRMFEKFDKSMVMHKAKNECKTYFYKKYLEGITDSYLEMNKIKEGAESMKIF